MGHTFGIVLFGVTGDLEDGGGGLEGGPGRCGALLPPTSGIPKPYKTQYIKTLSMSV